MTTLLCIVAQETGLTIHEVFWHLPLVTVHAIEHHHYYVHGVECKLGSRGAAGVSTETAFFLEAKTGPH